MLTVPAQLLKPRKTLFLSESIDLEIIQNLAQIHSEWDWLVFLLCLSFSIPFVIKADGRRETGRKVRTAKTQPRVREGSFTNSK